MTSRQERQTPPVGRFALLAALAAVGVALLAQAGLGAFGPPSGPPAPLITSAPIRNSVLRTATFGYAGVPGATFECSLDAGEFRACPARVTYRRLALGAHEFRVRARAAVGVPGASAAYAWRIVAPRPHPRPPAGSRSCRGQ